ncbi:MAG TPA: kynureninase [Chondromyces sp.]|nr:kynureninase [Chondromyces sp.]
MEAPNSRDEVLALDAREPLAAARAAFELPEGLVYLDGNSLGPPPATVARRIGEVLGAEWASDLVRSWTRHDWIDLPQRVAAAIAPLVGAARDEVMVADSVSINLFKLLGAALRLRKGRRVILSERENFGTDLYVAQGLADLLDNGTEVRIVGRDELEAVLGDEVAVLMLTHVDFRSGEMHDMARWTAAAHAAGALVLWDLAHSAGAVPVDLGGCGADLAVGCGYKYLNGGPGAPAFAFAARRHHAGLRSPLWGWMGHAAPFDFETSYRPGSGVGQLRVGTPPILSLAALECGVEGIAALGVERLRAKSIALSEMFIALVERECAGYGLELASPREAHRRGSQVSLRHPEGYAIVQALAAAGVVGDFRAPDLLRFGFAPAYLRFVDIWDAAAALRAIMETGSWDRPEHHERAKVT